MTERLLTAREVAELLGVSAETVLRWTRAGELRGYRLPGTARGRLRYSLEEVEAWLEQHATRAGDAARGVSATRNAAHPLEAYGPARPEAPAKPNAQHSSPARPETVSALLFDSSATPAARTEEDT